MVGHSNESMNTFYINKENRIIRGFQVNDGDIIYLSPRNKILAIGTSFHLEKDESFCNMFQEGKQVGFASIRKLVDNSGLIRKLACWNSTEFPIKKAVKEMTDYLFYRDFNDYLYKKRQLIN